MATEFPPAHQIDWKCVAFNDMTPHDLYAAMQLRQTVFIVEQNCVYMDADGLDHRAEHIMGWVNLNNWPRLIAYARIFPPRVKYAESSIGRVVTHPEFRRGGAGKALMEQAMKGIGEAGWGSEIRIAAQMYLERFYEGFGFKRVTEPYTEDDIWHVDMRRG